MVLISNLYLENKLPYEFKNEQSKNSNIHYLKTPFIKVS